MYQNNSNPLSNATKNISQMPKAPASKMMTSTPKVASVPIPKSAPAPRYSSSVKGRK